LRDRLRRRHQTVPCRLHRKSASNAPGAPPSPFAGAGSRTATVSEGPGRIRARAQQVAAAGASRRSRRSNALPAIGDAAGQRACPCAVPLDEPIRLADHSAPASGDAVLELGRRRCAAWRSRTRSSSSTATTAPCSPCRTKSSIRKRGYRDESLGGGGYVNSEGTSPLSAPARDSSFPGTAIARRNGSIEKGLESIGLRKGVGTAVQAFDKSVSAVGRRSAPSIYSRAAARARRRVPPVILDNELAGVFQSTRRFGAPVRSRFRVREPAGARDDDVGPALWESRPERRRQTAPAPGLRAARCPTTTRGPTEHRTRP